MTPGAVEVVHELMQRNISVYMVCGTYNESLYILSDYLKIPRENVFGVSLQFNTHGEYETYDPHQLLAQNGGKVRVIADCEPERDIVMVGDGITDLETKKIVDLFIGFGGVVKRSDVLDNADVWVEDTDLRGIFEYLELAM